MKSNLGLGVSNERSRSPLSLITFTASFDILLLVTFFKIVFLKKLHTMILYLNIDLAWTNSRSREKSKIFHLVKSLGHKKWETTWSQIFWALLAIWHTLGFSLNWIFFRILTHPCVIKWFGKRESFPLYLCAFSNWSLHCSNQNPSILVKKNFFISMMPQNGRINHCSLTWFYIKKKFLRGLENAHQTRKTLFYDPNSFIWPIIILTWFPS